MGGRHSVPRDAGGMTEAPVPVKHDGRASRRAMKLRTLLGPGAAILLCGIFFVYSRTTIAAAKENARRVRAADGGSISWRNEALRQKGLLERPEQVTLWGQLSGAGKEEGRKKEEEVREKTKARKDYNALEDGLRRAREGRKKVEEVVDEEDDPDGREVDS